MVRGDGEDLRFPPPGPFAALRIESDRIGSPRPRPGCGTLLLNLQRGTSAFFLMLQ